MSATTAAPLPTDEDLGVEEIPLPPEHIRDEIIAAELEVEAKAKGGDGAKGGEAVAPKPAPEVAKLNFVGGRPRRMVVDLSDPFDLDGVVIPAIEVRRLTGYEVAEFARAHLEDDGSYDRYELYSLMTGLPAPVLRGLDGDDGLDVGRACSDFLPRVLAAGA